MSADPPESPPGPPVDDPAPRRALLLWGGILILAAGAAALTRLLSDPAPPRGIRLATGDPDGAYFQYGRQMAPMMGRDGLQVETVQTHGSADNLRLLLEGKVEVAFVQAGVLSTLTGQPALGGLRAVARIYSEPIWVFSRGEAKRLTDLAPGPDGRQKRIVLGADGSAAQAIALDLLRASGVHDGNATLLRFDQAEAVDALRRGEVDALFKSGSYTAPAVQALLRMPGARLMSFPSPRAYTRRLPYLTAVEIDEGLLSIEENLPPAPITLLASSATLVARADTHPRVVELLLRTASRLFASGNLIDPPGDYPSIQRLELPAHDAARRYLTQGESWASKNLSFAALRLVDQLKLLLVPLLTVLLPAVRIVPALLEMWASYSVNDRYDSLRKVEARIRTAATPDDVERHLDEARSLLAEVNGLAARLPAAYQYRVYEWRSHFKLVQEEGALRLEQLRSAPPPDQAPSPEQST